MTYCLNIDCLLNTDNLCEIKHIEIDENGICSTIITKKGDVDDTKCTCKEAIEACPVHGKGV